MYEFKHKQNVTLDDYLRRHLEWGHAMFGTPADGRGPLGPLDHIKKEIVEIEHAPNDLKEWIDLIILGIDGFLRAGGKMTMLLPMLFEKQAKNAERNWPDWRTADPDKAIEHIRTPAEMGRKVMEHLTPADLDLKSMEDLAGKIVEEPIPLDHESDKLRYPRPMIPTKKAIKPTKKYKG